MKTTLELPDELARRVKMRAVEQDQKLEDAVAQLLEIGLAYAPRRKRLNRPPKLVRLQGAARLTIEDIEAAIAADRD